MYKANIHLDYNIWHTKCSQLWSGLFYDYISTFVTVLRTALLILVGSTKYQFISTTSHHITTNVKTQRPQDSYCGNSPRDLLGEHIGTLILIFIRFPWSLFITLFHITLSHGTSNPLFTLHSLSAYPTTNMGSSGWQAQVGRATFLQYLRSVNSSKLLNNHLTKPPPSPSSPTFPPSRNTPSVTSGSLLFTSLQPPVAPDSLLYTSFADDTGFNLIEILTKEDLAYFTILALCVLLVVSLGGYHFVAHCHYGYSVFCTRTEHRYGRGRRVSDSQSSSLPLLPQSESPDWGPLVNTPYFSTFPIRPFLPLRLATINGQPTLSSRLLQLYDYPSPEFRPVQSTRTVQFSPAIEIIPLPAYPTAAESGGSEIYSGDEEYENLPPLPAAVCQAETDDTYMQMV